MGEVKNMLKKVFVTFLLTIFAVGAIAAVIPSNAENAMAEVDFSGANSVYVTANLLQAWSKS